MYIEDTESARILVRRLLGRDYIVLEASDPINGIELARDTHPDLVLLDINLPHLSGREVATRLRSIVPDAPLVALTADATPGSREKALAAGCTGFITKPIDVDSFPAQVAEYLRGKEEALENAQEHLRAYQAELVEHLEAKVRELTSAVERNEYLNRQNRHIIAMLERRQHLLEAAARVSHNITSILELDELLRATVDILCDEFSLYYSGIFLLSEDGQWAVLRAGYSEAGARMISTNFRLHVDRHSMIGSCILEKKARIALDVEGEPSHFRNPLLPATRSEIALPLVLQDRVLGAITVQSAELNAFGEDDITALQSLADQIAIAIGNAQLLQQLEAANAELLRTKTFEAIATATGEAIHWVGNKAAPIPGSAQRVREDLLTL
ncbi:MAG: response regulator, partial [Anaerolineae bacterium]